MTERQELYGPQRLQKVLAAAGVGSRRKCEEYIAEGRIKVNGEVVDILGTRVDAQKDVLHFDDVRVITDPKLITVMLNKPRDVLSAMEDGDGDGRPTLSSFVSRFEQRLFHIGRLDIDSSGLLLLTNDGELAHRLAHPSYEIPKTYQLKLKGNIPRNLAKILDEGIELEDGHMTIDRKDFRMLGQGKSSTHIQVTITEGRNRILRRTFEHVGFPVTDLVRIGFGPLMLGDLRVGQARKLSDKEVGTLYKAVGL